MTVPATLIADTYRAGDAGVLAWATKISDLYNAYVNTGANRLWEPSDFLTRPASAITYDTSTSALTSTNAQGALDEIVDMVDALSVAPALGRIGGNAPSPSGVNTSEAVLYWDPATQLVKVEGKDSIGVAYNQTVGGTSTVGSTLDELEITAALQSITGTAGTFTDVSIGGNVVAVQFVAPTSTTRLEWAIAPVLIQTATAASSLSWRVIEGGVRTLGSVGGGQVPSLASGQFLPLLNGSPREVPTVAGNTYTWKLQVQLPSSGTATFSWFAVNTDNPTFLRVKAA